MIAHELINQMIPALKASDTIQMAIDWMEEFKLIRLPVEGKGQFKGLIPENILLECHDWGQEIKVFENQFRAVSCLPETHLIDVAKGLQENKSDIIAVVNEKNEYLGCISSNDVFNAFSKISSFNSLGGILEIRLNENDYSLSQISRIIESNGAKVMSSFIKTDPETPAELTLTLKLNKEDLSAVISGLERQQYRVVGKHHKSEIIDDSKERLDSFFKYLNI